MSSLADFVSEQRNKAGASNRTYFNVATLGSKVSNSFNGFFKTGSAPEDAERLTDENPNQNGELPPNRNRRMDSWMSFSSSSTSKSIAADSNPCGLNRFQRMAAFFLCLIAAAFCFTTAMMLIPVLVFQTRKFATLNTLGSVFFITSFGFLWGPLAYCKFLFSEPRRLVTAVYLSTVLATLYTSLWLHSTIFTIIASTFQAFGLVWFLLSYVPGGENGLKWMGRMTKMAFCAKQSSTLVLPI